MFLIKSIEFVIAFNKHNNMSKCFRFLYKIIKQIKNYLNMTHQQFNILTEMFYKIAQNLMTKNLKLYEKECRAK